MIVWLLDCVITGGHDGVPDGVGVTVVVAVAVVGDRGADVDEFAVEPCVDRVEGVARDVEGVDERDGWLWCGRERHRQGCP